jgi:hypothetical protein
MVCKVLTVYSTSPYTVRGKAVTVPQIRLQGKWLESLGVTAASKFKLFAGEGLLILKLIKEV